ncbi:hypothetical protein [Mucilaginibacter xinganensis]|nr:hypothetical protein [Mucilaginibacter xinganensis]
MKKFTLAIIALFISVGCFAQDIPFPFQGGKDAMTGFFKDSLVVSQDIIQKKATGAVIFKFSADAKGNIQKTIVYYADDAVLVTPVIEALKKSNHKWVIPNHEKLHDFIIPFYIRYNLPETPDAALKKAAFDNYRNKRPILPGNQIPLDLATLLPAITINYDVAP